MRATFDGLRYSVFDQDDNLLHSFSAEFRGNLTWLGTASVDQHEIRVEGNSKRYTWFKKGLGQVRDFADKIEENTIWEDIVFGIKFWGLALFGFLFFSTTIFVSLSVIGMWKNHNGRRTRFSQMPDFDNSHLLRLENSLYQARILCFNLDFPRLCLTAIRQNHDDWAHQWRWSLDYWNRTLVIELSTDGILSTYDETVMVAYNDLRQAKPASNFYSCPVNLFAHHSVFPASMKYLTWFPAPSRKACSSMNKLGGIGPKHAQTTASLVDLTVLQPKDPTVPLFLQRDSEKTAELVIHNGQTVQDRLQSCDLAHDIRAEGLDDDAQFALTNDARIVTAATNKQLWPKMSNTLSRGVMLRYLESSNGQHQVHFFQQNCTLHRRSKTQTGTATVQVQYHHDGACEMILQKDNNLVVYEKGSTTNAHWASGTQQTSPSMFLKLQENGGLLLRPDDSYQLPWTVILEPFA